MQSLTGTSTIIDRYDAILMDLWGVVHDGTHLYPGVYDTLVRYKELGKKIVMVSNAPRRAARVIAVLEELGVDKSLYLQAVSSGEVGYRWLGAGKASWGKRYYYIGPAKDADVLNGLDYQRVDDLKEADFLLNVGFGSEERSLEDNAPLLRAARALGLPMLCLNPDLEVVKITGERFACAGVIARAYEQMGGKVQYFGKPYGGIYEACMEILAPIEKSKILAIGDSLGTDIKGAFDFGIDSVLVTGGILKQHTPQELKEMCVAMGARPNYVMPSLQF